MSLTAKLVNSCFINADCLRVLERLDDRSIDLVYLDPPWNTGSDFVYINDPSQNYENFIFSVLQQAKRVLKLDGNLVFHSVPSLNVDFHNLISPIFGRENFRAEFILPIRDRNLRNKMFHHNHETIINYAISEKSKFYPLIEKSKKEIDAQFPLSDNGTKYRLQSLTIHGDRSVLSFDWKGFTLAENEVWRYSKNKLNELDAQNKIFYEKGMKYPKLKVFATDFSLHTVDSVWTDIAAYDHAASSPGQQSIKILDRIIKLFTNENDLLLDPFSGTGTSGVSSSKLGRTWIGIEHNKEIYSNSCPRFVNVAIDFFQYKDIESFEIIWSDYDSVNESDADRILKWIEKGENERLEFKEMFLYNRHEDRTDGNMPKKIIKEIVGFMNSKFGGTILIGVNDEGHIIGVEDEFIYTDPRKQNVDGFELALTNKIKDTLGGSVIDLVNISFVEIKEKLIALIEISPTKIPVFLGDDFIVRNGSTSIPLKAKEYHELMRERNLLK